MNHKAWYNKWSTTGIMLLFIACGKAEQPTQEDPGEMQSEVPQARDVYDPDYWEEAELVWRDEFEGENLDPDKWAFETGSHGWGNHEWQNYVEEGSTEVGEGTLKIIAKKVGDGHTVGEYTSARLNSKASFTYGRMEIRAKIPEHRGNGIWPAIWMLGTGISTVGWPACGEIDIMEYVSFEPDQTHFSLHSTANNHKIGTQVTSGPVKLETMEEAFHNYGILWTEKYIKFYIDEMENVKLTFFRPLNSNADNWPFSNPFYFLLNIAVGGDWGGLEGVDDSIFPAVMEIDYVRVYQVR